MDIISFTGGLLVGIVVGYLLWAVVIPGVATVLDGR